MQAVLNFVTFDEQTHGNRFQVDIVHAHSREEYRAALASAWRAKSMYFDRPHHIYEIAATKVCFYEGEEYMAVNKFKDVCSYTDPTTHQRYFLMQGMALHTFIVFSPRQHRRWHGTTECCCTWMTPRANSVGPFAEIVGARIARAVESLSGVLGHKLKRPRVVCKHLGNYHSACTKHSREVSLRGSLGYTNFAGPASLNELTCNLDGAFFAAELGVV